MASNGKEEEEEERVVGADDFKVVQLLGVGSQGKVYLVNLVDTDKYYAMKVFEKKQILQNEKTTDSILTEHRFLATSQHPFITKLSYSFHSNDRLFLIMEYCPGGELFQAIKKQPNGRLTEDQVKFYASEVILVLEYIHSKGYIYRDLKPENILLHLDGHIRMADFGLSKQQEGYQLSVARRVRKGSVFSSHKTVYEYQPGEVVRTNSLVGTVHYLAPEVLQYTEDGYDSMADWWALGVLIYDMLFGFPPFQGNSNHEVFKRILNCNYSFPSDIAVSKKLKDLIKQLLRLDPKKRLGIRHGAQDIKKHPFFNGIHWGLLRNRTPPIKPVVTNAADTSNFMRYDEDEEGEDKFAFFSELEDNYKVNPNSSERDKRFKSFSFRTTSFYNGVPQKFKARTPAPSSSLADSPKEETSLEEKKEEVAENSQSETVVPKIQTEKKEEASDNESSSKSEVVSPRKKKKHKDGTLSPKKKSKNSEALSPRKKKKEKKLKEDATSPRSKKEKSEVLSPRRRRKKKDKNKSSSSKVSREKSEKTESVTEQSDKEETATPKHSKGKTDNKEQSTSKENAELSKQKSSEVVDNNEVNGTHEKEIENEVERGSSDKQKQKKKDKAKQKLKDQEQDGLEEADGTLGPRRPQSAKKNKKRFKPT